MMMMFAPMLSQVASQPEQTLPVPDRRDDTALNPKNSFRRWQCNHPTLPCRSTFTMVCEQAEAQQNPAVESIICNHLASMQVDVSQEMIRNLDGEGGFFTGESVSSCTFDQSNKIQTNWGAGEPMTSDGQCQRSL
jgi:hypothetical protein